VANLGHVLDYMKGFGGLQLNILMKFFNGDDEAGGESSCETLTQVSETVY